MIARRPISDLPASLRDGRRLLLWAKGGPQVGWWRGRWLCTRLGAPLEHVTHWAEIGG